MKFAIAAMTALLLLCASACASAAQASESESDFRVKATGTTTARGQADVNADRLNVKSFGADGNTQGWADGIVAVGGLTFSSGSATFTSDDCQTGTGCTGRHGDKAFNLTGAGKAGATLSGSITSFIDAHHVGITFSGGATPTYATPYYGIMPNIRVVTPEKITGSYAPGDIIQPAIRNAIRPARFKVMDTTVVHVAVANGGEGGTDGKCILVGTTGTRRSIPTVTSNFRISATVSHGAVVAVDNATLAGSDYTTNPKVSPAVEPVFGIRCGDLKGATVRLMTGAYPSIYGFNYVDSGNYISVARGSYSTAAMTGAGAGLVVSIGGTTEMGGQFEYGIDDSSAFAGAINQANALYAQGRSVCVYVPGGDYLIKTTAIPSFVGNACVIGDAPTASVLHVDPSYPGPDVFSAGGNWLGATISQPWNGPTTTVSARIGPTFKSFRIIGDRTAAHQQNGIDLYDMNDLVNMEDIDVFNLKGHALCLGCYTKNHARCGVRESHFDRLRFFRMASHGQQMTTARFWASMRAPGGARTI